MLLCFGGINQLILFWECVITFYTSTVNRTFSHHSSIFKTKLPFSTIWATITLSRTLLHGVRTRWTLIYPTTVVCYFLSARLSSNPCRHSRPPTFALENWSDITVKLHREWTKRDTVTHKAEKQTRKPTYGIISPSHPCNLNQCDRKKTGTAHYPTNNTRRQRLGKALSWYINK